MFKGFREICEVKEVKDCGFVSDMERDDMFDEHPDGLLAEMLNKSFKLVPSKDELAQLTTK